MFAHAYWWKDYSEDYSKMYIVTISWLLIFMLEAAFVVQIYSLETRVSSLKESLEQHFGMNGKQRNSTQFAKWPTRTLWLPSQ